MTTLNRKLFPMAIALVGALAACSSGQTIGTPDGSYSARPTTPSPSTTKPTKPANSPTKTQAPPPTKPAPNAKTYKVATLDGQVWDTYDIQATAGDKVVYENKASDGDHSFTIASEGIDSGVKSKGEKFTFVVSLAPGSYEYKCTVVPYMVGGKLTVY